MAGRSRVAFGGRRGAQNTRQGRRGRTQGGETSGFGATILEENEGNGGPSHFGDGTCEFVASRNGGVQFEGGFNSAGGGQSRAFNGARGRHLGANASPGRNGRDQRNREQQLEIEGGLGLRGGAKGNTRVDFANDAGRSALGGRGRGQRRTLGGSLGAGKGLSFTAEEERQLTRSVLAISQDQVTGNQQKQFSFWKRIHEHYDSERPGGVRPARSLESKWGQIKHDVNKFIGAYQQTLNLQMSGTSPADTLRMAKDLYRTKHAKSADFTFEHCWVLVKDFPRWAEGWGTVKNATLSKRKTVSSGQESEDVVGECCSTAKETASGDRNQGLRDRPTGTKAAKVVLKADKVAEKALCKQAAASEVMAAAVMQKVRAMEDHNLILLMTAPDGNGIQSHEAQEFMRLRQKEELKKLQKRLAADEQKDLDDVATRGAEEQLRIATELARQATEERDIEETRRQLEERNPHLEDLSFSGEEDQYEDNGEFEENDEQQFQDGDGFQDSETRIREYDNVIRETQEIETETENEWQPPMISGVHNGRRNMDLTRDSYLFTDRSPVYDSRNHSSSVHWNGISQVDPGMQTTWQVLDSRTLLDGFVEGNDNRDNGNDVSTGLILNSETYYHG